MSKAMGDFGGFSVNTSVDELTTNHNTIVTGMGLLFGVGDRGGAYIPLFCPLVGLEWLTRAEVALAYSV